MANEYDDEPDYRSRDDRNDRLERAKGKLALAGLVLILASLFGLFLEIASIGVTVAKPTLFYDTLKGALEKNPPSPERDQQLKDLEKSEAAMRLDTPENITFTAIGTVLCVIALLGGIRMRSGSGYGLALTGAICSLIPIAGCCCAGMPAGLWAIIVLLNSDVKKVFANSSVRDPHDSYEG